MMFQFHGDDDIIQSIIVFWYSCCRYRFNIFYSWNNECVQNIISINYLLLYVKLDLIVNYIFFQFLFMNNILPIK